MLDVARRSIEPVADGVILCDASKKWKQSFAIPRHLSYLQSPLTWTRSMNRMPIVWLLCASFAVGCKVDPTPRSVAEFRAGQRPSMQHADYDGEYRLYKLSEQARSYLDDAAVPAVSVVHLK